MTVLTDFKTGTVDIAPPELGGSLEAKEKDVDLTNELNEATEALAVTTGEWTTDYSDQLAGLADQLAALASQQAEGSADTQQAISAVVMAIRNQADATKDGAEAADASTKQQIKGTRDVAEGIFRIVRATALLTGVNDESMQSLVKNLALVQGAFDIYKGGSNLIQGLQTMNPLLLGVGAAVGAAATAWNAYADAKERARK